MHFTDIFVKRPVLATVVSLLILLAGLQAAFKLPIRQFPEVSDVKIEVTTAYPGANADQIKGFITTPLQQAVASAEGIDTLESRSSQNVSTITLKLRLDADADRALATQYNAWGLLATIGLVIAQGLAMLLLLQLQQGGT